MVNMKKLVKITLSLICCVLLISFSLLFVTACFGKITGPYHYSSVITIPGKVVSIESKKYCIVDSKIYELADNGLKRVSTLHANDEAYVGGASNIQTDGEYLYVSHSSISKFTFDYKYIGKVTEGTGTIKSFLLSGQKIYYTKDNNENPLHLYLYNMSTSEHSVISDNILNQVINTDDGQIYSNKKGKLFWVTGIEGVNQAYGSSHYSAFSNDKLSSLGFYYEGVTGEIDTQKNSVKIKYLNENYDYLLNKSICLYNRILVKDNKLIFSVYEFLENKECINNFCLCHIGISYLIQFDFKSKKFDVLKTLDAGEYFISFDNSGYSYYSDGETVSRNSEKSTVNKVEPFGQFKIEGGDSKYLSYRNQSIFCESDGKIYYLFIDNELYLKDLYF